MGKKKRKKKKIKTINNSECNLPADIISWQDEEGVHFVAPGEPPSAEMYEKMTLEYQRRVRKSPLWDEMVRQFGLKKAKEMLKEFRVEPRPPI